MSNPKDKSALADNKTAVYPILDTPEGRLQCSSVIMRYLAHGHALEGASAFEKAAVQNWMDFITYELEPVML